MGSYMQKEIFVNKRIVYFSNGYLPEQEGASKELLVLYSHFSKKFNGKVYLHNLADRWQFGLRRGFLSYPDRLLPIGYPLLKYLERSCELAHIYGSLTGRLYINLIKKRPCIITNTKALTSERLEKCMPLWGMFEAIIVESEQDRQTLEDLGVGLKRLRLIYPGVPVQRVKPPLRENPFTILFASAPIAKDPKSLQHRGVSLIIETAKRMPDCQFILLWRGRHTRLLYRMLSEAGCDNIKIIDRIVPNVADVLADTHTTILCPEKADGCKPCPTSLTESLACGRPILVTDRVGIANIVREEGCGIVFGPDASEVHNAIRRLQDDYENHVTKALPTALKYFSAERFINSYELLYEEFGLIQ